MVAGPLVDHVKRLAVGKVARLGIGEVIVVGLADEIGVQLIAQALVHIDCVTDHHLRQRIERWGGIQHLLAERIDGVGTRITKAQHLLYLLLCLASSPVVEHAQGVGDADR